jgi:hypothetical protein
MLWLSRSARVFVRVRVSWGACVGSEQAEGERIGVV